MTKHAKTLLEELRVTQRLVHEGRVLNARAHALR